MAGSATAAQFHHGDDGLLWRRVPSVPDGCLRLDLTLFCGQAFRWVDCGTVLWRGKQWRECAGVLHRSLLVLRQADEELPTAAYAGGVDVEDPVFYAVVSENAERDDRSTVDAALCDYLRAGVDMRPIAADLCRRDERYARVFPYFRGGRPLRQHPTECLFAFICSSNNNVQRITSMVTYLASAYGDKIGEYKGTLFHAFPTIMTLASRATEADLRAAGFGYRARFITAAAAQLQALGAEEYLLSLRKMSRQDTATALVSLMGVGRKVAGCVALMSLDVDDEIPVDTHVWQIACRDYLPSLRAKTLTDRIYTQVGDMFRDKHGPFAGWSSQTLFCAELGPFKDRLPAPFAAPALLASGKRKKKSPAQKAAKVESSSRKNMRTSAGIGDVRAGLRSRKRIMLTHIPAKLEIGEVEEPC
jgi:N-glycosylase/DNA lyase